MYDALEHPERDRNTTSYMKLLFGLSPFHINCLSQQHSNNLLFNGNKLILVLLVRFICPITILFVINELYDFVFTNKNI